VNVHVIYDNDGNIISAAAATQGETRCAPRAGMNQLVGEIELPAGLSEQSILQLHEQFRVEVRPGGLRFVPRRP
jgi:hypothetical protein